MRSPPTHYVRSGDASIAYQTVGDGPCDLVVVNGPASHLELMWEEPGTARTFGIMAEYARLIMFDRRGRLHRASLHGRGRSLANAAGGPQPRGPLRAAALVRTRGQDQRRRLPGHLRRPRSRRRLCCRDRRGRGLARAQDPRRRSHRECELREDDVAGIAVHIASRVMYEAAAGEVLASSTVKDLVAGSGLRFADRGPHELRGVGGAWRLYALER